MTIPSDARRITVVHVVRQFHPAIGGLEDAVANLAAELASAHNIEASVLTLDRLFGDRKIPLPATGEHLGVSIRRVPFRGSKRYPIALSTLRHLSSADLIHVHGIDFFFDFLSATRFLHRRPLVVSTHGGFFHTQFGGRLKHAYFNTATRISARGYARIFGSSENDSQMFRRIAPKRTVTIENGVNVSKWSGASSETAVPVMLFIGRFSTNKRIPALFDLLAALKDMGSTWRLIVAGQPSDLTAEDLRHAAAIEGVEEAVEIITGATDAEMIDLIARASYIVSASRYEGFGLSIVEGMSAGLTPFISNIAPFQKLIATTGVGALFDPEDPVRAANTLMAIHASQRAAPNEARGRNQDGAALYGWAEPAARFAEAYRAVLAEDRSSP